MVMHIKPFIHYIREEKRYSEHTIQAYLKDLEQFHHYCKEQYAIEDLTQINQQQIRSWIVHLINESKTPKSVNRKLSTLRSFFKYCLKMEYVTSNPTFGLQGPKAQQKNPVFIPESQINKLFDNIQYPEGYEGARDRLILELFYFTGMRKAELIGLLMKDVNLEKGAVKVLGKRNKERLIPISKPLIASFKKFITLRETEQFSTDHDNVFLTSKGKPLQPRQVYTIVNKYLNSVTTVDKKSPHILRHSFATHMLNNGADINGIKEILGHSTLAATEVYTHNSFEKLKSIHKKAHPKG